MDIAPNRPDEWGALMRAAQEGDGTAYAALLGAITPVIRALGRRQGLERGACEDLAQDVLLTIHRVRQTYDPDRPFAPWLMAIAHRRLIDLRRRRGRVSRHEAQDDLALETFAAPDAKDHVEQAEWSRALQAAIAELPPRQREALELTKLREMSVADAAARTGQTPGALKVNVHRALRSLQVRMGGRRP